MIASQPALLPEIHVGESELRAALEARAVPNFTGSVDLKIGLVEVEVDGQTLYMVAITVDQEEHHAAEPEKCRRQILPDPSRKKPVDNVLSQVRPRLFIRPVLRRLTTHFKAGVVTGFKMEE